MSDSEEISDSSEGRSQLDVRLVGKVIVWAMMALIGWSFLSTQQHDKAIAVMERDLRPLEEKIDIDKRLSAIERQLPKLAGPKPPLVCTRSGSNSDYKSL